MTALVNMIRNTLRATGYDVIRFNPSSSHVARLRRLFDGNSIDLVLDVGANEGQFSGSVRRHLGYRGRIISFEPLTSAFKLLGEHIGSDKQWTALNIALGESNHRTQINVAGNSQSSSMLGMLPAHENAAPSSRYVGKQDVEVRTLDSVWAELKPTQQNIFMKIDTQGFEAQVIKGASETLKKIGAVQIEMSLTPLYEGQPLFADILALMKDAGFSLFSLEPGFSDRSSGRMLQVDGVFCRYH